MEGASKLPGFTEGGLLPPGDYELTLEELGASLLVVGPEIREHCPNWDAAWRGQLVENLGVLVRQLWQVGISAIFVDGSFAEGKERPNDIDGYFECELVRLAPVASWNGTSTSWTRTKSGPGIRRADVRFGATRRSNCRCGTSTVSSCTRTTGSFAAFETSMAMSLSSRRLFDGRGGTVSLVAL